MDDVDEDARALAMEYVPGGTLRERIRAHPHGLPPDEVSALAVSLLSALAFVHARGIVHGHPKLSPCSCAYRAMSFWPTSAPASWREKRSA